MKSDQKNLNQLSIKKENKKGIYIHIPFCKYICKYCDFCKKYIKYYDTSDYIDSLIINLNMNKEYFSSIDTIYIGGGTPSTLPYKDLKKLLEYLNENISMDKIAEFTIEANPDDINEQFLELLVKNNINRISLGVQSTTNSILQEVGREHTKEHVINAINLIPKYIENLNIDLMFNLPSQNLQSVKQDLEFIRINQDKIKHVSYYSLILEENTMLYNDQYENWSEDEESEVYKYIQKELLKLGYNQYEISNFSKMDYESKHNLKYWLREEYIGIGLGASSFINNKRYTITKSYNEYIKGIENNVVPLLEEEVLTKKDYIIEKIILGLRISKGVKKSLFKDNYLKINSKYLIEENGRVCINSKYYFLSNDIITDILIDIDEKVKE